MKPSTEHQSAVAFAAPAKIRQLASLPYHNRRRRPRRRLDYHHAKLATFGNWLVNQQSAAYFVLDLDATIIVTNDAAREVLSRETFATSNGRTFSFRNARHAAAFDKVMKQVRSVTLPAPVRLASATGSIEITAVRPRDGHPFVVIRFADRSQHKFSSVTPLRTDLGLTPAEAKIALAIFNGDSMPAIAKRLGISHNTVKTHVRHIFQKCGVRSQRGVVRRVGEVCEVRK